MANKQTSLENILEDIDARLKHIEDITADNRTVVVKLVKQGNTIVEFLKGLQIEEIEMDPLMGMEETVYSSLPELEKNNIKRTEMLKEMVDEILESQKDLKEFEKEMKKHKDKIVPGQVGES